jgi:hypothetical protein
MKGLADLIGHLNPEAIEQFAAPSQNGNMSIPQTAPPANPAGTQARRRPGSTRRTTSISTVWPEGPGNPMLMTGEARDLITHWDGSTTVAALGYFEIMASHQREVITIKTRPDFPTLQRLVGLRAGGNLRLAICAAIPQEKTAGSPLYQLLDDFCGASLVAPWAWTVWNPEWMRNATFNNGRKGNMEGICVGFPPGSANLNENGRARSTSNRVAVPEITDPGDKLGWHEMVGQNGPGVRRLRRIDVWREQGTVRAHAHFQDGATHPSGGRMAIHEYLLSATADAATGAVLDLEADPRILPYRECPGAVPLMTVMLGQQLPDFRLAVLESMPGIKGCTHLNDMLRALADAPALSETLDAA